MQTPSPVAVGSRAESPVSKTVRHSLLSPPQVATTPRTAVAESSKTKYAPSIRAEDARATGRREEGDFLDSEIAETYIHSGHSTDDEDFSVCIADNVSTPQGRESRVDTTSSPAPSGVLPAVPNTPPPRGRSSQRTSTPNYPQWQRCDLKVEAQRLGSRAGLRVNSNAVLKSVTSATKNDLAKALVDRTAWRKDQGQSPEWKETPIGITPVKKASAKKPKVEGAGPPKAPTPKRAYHCRLLAAMGDERLFALYTASRNNPTRAEQDAKAIGHRHPFYVELAKVMADRDWKDSNGNEISLPDDHKGDTSAPDTLRSRLEGLDLISPADTLLGSLELGSDGKPDYEPLQKQCVIWLKEIKSEYTIMEHKVSISGGNGADVIAKEDGGDGTETKDAKHAWNFCNGRLPTLICKDLMSLRAGGANSGLADPAIPDGVDGAMSSVPGNTGTTSSVRGAQAHQPSRAGGVKGKHKQSKGDPEAEAWSEAKALLSRLGDTEKLVQERETLNIRASNLELAQSEAELAANRVKRNREEAAEVEGLIQDVLRVSATLNDLAPDADECLREACQELVNEAKAELNIARARKKARKATELDTAGNK